ncbi:hypothetical protein F2P56_007531 [Juglans regia]|uniref:Nuclear envelope integral membrane protein 1 n=2 Tax=Juglans regia TaxID=51240 RepID=A0A833Y1N1_JUGRE|nr:uncharacterized protein LOC108982988 isoform X1 [Juglans regia]KAF5475756.1 hypothetical protein F2P56_007531 [Juglans regia]
MGSSLTAILLLSLFLSLFITSASHETTTLKGVDLENPSIVVFPSPLSGYSASHGSKEALLCERVQISGLSRLRLGSYASSLRVTLSPSVEIPERLHGKIQVCFHGNNSRGLCQCEDDEWKYFKGLWSSVMSPYEDRYIDVKFFGEVSGSVTVAVEEDFQQWRLACLALGFVLLLLAPIVSNWVPFYYSSSMLIGVFLVIIIILFQGMKLLPTGRKNVLYLTMYGSVLGAGSFLIHHLSMFVNSVLITFGLNEEMHNPVFIFVLVGIILAGAALGYWIVRKFVVSKDGRVDVGIAQFVKWAMSITGTTAIIQGTLDTPFALATVVSCWAFRYLILSLKRLPALHKSFSVNRNPLLKQERKITGKHNRAEFHSRSGSAGKMWHSPKNQSAWSNSPVGGVISPSSGTKNQQEYYSTFHKMRNRKKFTEKEWDDFTRESTRQAIAEWAASPEFTDWMIENADRVKLLPSESSDETMGSESDSTDENLTGRHRQFRLTSG